jgi:hypothetical protein
MPSLDLSDSDDETKGLVNDISNQNQAPKLKCRRLLGLMCVTFTLLLALSGAIFLFFSFQKELHASYLLVGYDYNGKFVPKGESNFGYCAGQTHVESLRYQYHAASESFWHVGLRNLGRRLRINFDSKQYYYGLE